MCGIERRTQVNHRESIETDQQTTSKPECPLCSANQHGGNLLTGHVVSGAQVA